MTLKEHMKRRDRRFHIIMGSICLLVLGCAVYLDYPEFAGFAGFKTHFLSTFNLWMMLGIVGVVSVITIPAVLLFNKQKKWTDTVKPGDKVFYNGEKAIVQSIDPDNSNRVKIDIEVNAMQLSENDFDEE